MHSDVKVINTEQTNLGFLTINKHRLKHRLINGQWSKEMTRLVVERGHSAAVLAVDLTRQCVVLTRQFRIGALESENPWLIELIAGVIDQGESPEQSAIREAKEETGADITIQCEIATFYGSPGACSEKTTVFYGTVDSEQCLEKGGHSSENEDIEVIKMPIGEFIKKVEANEFQSASLIIAGLWLKMNLCQISR